MGSRSTEWCMKLFRSKERYIYVSLCLLSPNGDPLAEGKVKVSLISENGNKHILILSKVISLDTTGPLCRGSFQDIFNKCVDIGNTFKIEVEFITTTIISKPQTNIGVHRKVRSVGDDMGALLDTGDLSDVVLCAGDTELKAHRLLLSARSPVFAAMLRHNTKEAQTGRIHIQDVDPDTLCEVLRYIYTGRVPNINKMADKLLVAADKYDLQDLKMMCELQLAEKLRVGNAAATAVIALSHSCSFLKSSVVSFIKGNVEAVLLSDGWLDATSHHTQIVVEISRLVADKTVK